MEVDSGAACSLISEHTYRSLWPSKPPEMHADSGVLKQWSKATLDVKGRIFVEVLFKGTRNTLPLFIIGGQGTCLLGQDWFEALGISVEGVHRVQFQTMENILTEYAEVFQDIGVCRMPPISIDIDSMVTPRFFKARPVPFALRPQLDEELDKLVAQGIFEPVRHARWATPIVAVAKKDGGLRICGDYRCTVNTAVKPDVYPIPIASELFSKLAGGVVFTKLDLKQAYQQLPLDNEAADLLTINTHRGLFRARRLQFGVSTAVSIFQRFMDTLLAGIPGVQRYLDDILISGKTMEEHNARLRAVLKCFAEAGLRLKKEKSIFAATQVEFLGFHVDKDGIKPTCEKVDAIQKAPSPRNKTELQAFLGLLNFYSCFLPNKATVLEPLHRLLDQSVPWRWDAKHEMAYAQAKQLLQTDKVLAHYDEKKPLAVVCDASPYVLGASLFHLERDGQEKPICFASRTMTTTERNYAQVDKEALAVVFAIRKFHQYLAGRHFVIFTDHKPLLGLLHHSKPMPVILSPRMLRWSLIMGAYDYELCYRPGKQMGNADALSRLPLPAPDAATPPLEVLLLEMVPDAPMHAEKIASCTLKDPVMSRVLHW
uniref:ribonuclease H n=1 Tax=Paramormyrops kingsleyae TaxID=1676925 RepID=A0A3B3RQE8_9TELE